MPGTDHLSDRQRARLSEALLRRDGPIVSAMVLGGAAVFPLLFIGLFVLRWWWLLPTLLAATIVGVPIVTILGHGRARRIMIEELSRLGPLPICPRCGYDLRATPQCCPECGLVLEQPNPPPDGSQ